MSLQDVAPLLDTMGAWLAVILTLFVFSYLLGDNVLYRIAEHLFVGVTIGYVAVLAFHQVLAPRLLLPIADAAVARNWQQMAPLAVTLLLGLFLFAKPFKVWSWLGNISMAVLLGVGSALAIGGALVGTLLPQIDAAASIDHFVARYGQPLGLVSGLLVLIGASGVLLHFYSNRDQDSPWAQARSRVVSIWGGVGRWFLVVAFGALLATTFTARLSLLVDRVQFFLDAVRGLFGG